MGVLQYSMSGNTAYGADRIAEITGADLLRIEPEKAYPKIGFRKFLWGGKSAVMAETPSLEPYEFDGADYDCIIFGFPVWAGNIAPPIRTFIKENDLSGKHFAAFACQSGSGAERAFARLKSCLKTDRLEAELILIDPKDKPNGENDKRLKAFCSEIAGLS